MTITSTSLLARNPVTHLGVPWFLVHDDSTQEKETLNPRGNLLRMRSSSQQGVAR